MGDFSKEFCGGTHVSNTGKIQAFKILSESGVAAGVRRIEALTGQGVFDYYNDLEKKLEEAGWTVIRLTPEQQNAFAEKGRKASWPELKKAIGDKAYEEVISTFVLE